MLTLTGMEARGEGSRRGDWAKDSCGRDAGCSTRGQMNKGED